MPSSTVGFADLYAVVELILEKLNIDGYAMEIVHDAPFEYALKLTLGEKELGTLGMLRQEVRKLAGVKQEVLFAELNWDLLGKKAKGLKKFQEISKFPEVRRDLSLVIDKNVTFDIVKKIALKAGGKLLQRINVFDVYQGDKIGADKKAYALSFYLQDSENTLTDKMIDKTMDRLIQTFETDAGAFIRK
jgi:phenylalanyl-tRNA synthetase beta chain